MRWGKRGGFPVQPVLGCFHGPGPGLGRMSPHDGRNALGDIPPVVTALMRSCLEEEYVFVDWCGEWEPALEELACGAKSETRFPPSRGSSG